MRSSLTQRELLGWQKYWEQEPWGAFRDNLHAAILAREIRRPQLRRGSAINIDDFMVRPNAQSSGSKEAKFFDLLRVIAKPARGEVDDRSS